MPDGPGGWGLPSRNITSAGSGSGLGGILREFHVPWPACNQDAARQAAEAWKALAVGIDDINAECNNMVNSITANNSGKAIDAFAESWQKYGGKSGSLALSSEACRALATACDTLADRVSEVKTEIEHKADELVAAVAAAAIVLIFTWGASIAVAEGVGEAVAEAVTEMMATLADQAAEVSITLSNAVGFAGEAGASIAGSVTEGALTGAVRGSFAAMLDQEFGATLNYVNGDPQPSDGDLLAGLGKDAGVTALLGVVAEALPATVNALNPRGVVNQAYVEALDFNPQLANAIMSSAKVAELLDTPAGKAFVASGGIATLHAKGVLDETENTAHSVETALEAAISQMGSGGE